MVAATGLREGIRPLLAWSLLIVALLGTFAAIYLNSQTLIPLRLTPGKSPYFLAERSAIGAATQPIDCPKPRLRRVGARHITGRGRGNVCHK